MQARIVGISFSVVPGEAAYIPLAHTGPDAPVQLPLDEVLARLKPWLEDPARKKLGQHIKYDRHVLANHGIEVAGYAHDTMLQSYVLEVHRPHNLASLAERHLGRSGISYEDLCGKGAHQIPFAQVPVDKAARIRARTRTRRWTCTACCGRACRPMRACAPSTSWRCSAARCCSASSATAC
jgi:DNA polymerase-1